jgi:hypothetical protein
MSWRDVKERFLPVNKLRRADAKGQETKLKSESGNRFVMGRKGVGKLAGFGAAERVQIDTKRAGSAYRTTILMDDRTLSDAGEIGKIPIPATYIDGLPTWPCSI